MKNQYSIFNLQSSMALQLFTIGFISILGQVVILREISVALYGVELVYILAMGVWLFWTACGAMAGKSGFVPPGRGVGYLLALFAIVLPVDIAFIRGVRDLFGAVPGAYLPFIAQLMAIMISLLPLGLLLGLIFQWAAKIYIDEGPEQNTLAMAYAIESFGGLLGGLSSTVLLQLGVQNFTISILCALSSVGIAMLPGKNRTPRTGYTALIVLVVLFGILGFSSWIDLHMTQWNHPNLIVSKDSPYSRITIEGQSGQFVVFENDAIGFETQSTAAEEFVHLSAIHHQRPKRVLILGGGVEGIVEEILKHSPQRIDYVELNSVLLALVQKQLPERYQKFLASKTVHIHHGDPRNFLKNTDRYDLILTGMPEPSSGQSNRFYTLEYFKQCANQLNPGGVFAFRLPSSENIWTALLSYRNAAISFALESAFKDVLVLPGVTNTIIAANVPLSRDPKVLSENFLSRNIEARLITPSYIHYLYTNDRFFEIADRLSATRAVPNTDMHPVCYQYSSMIWLSKFIPKMINWDISFLVKLNAMGFNQYTFLFLILCGLFLLVRCFSGFRGIALVAIAGFLGMILETVILLHYQTKSGILFQNIGVLLMAFMAGLAAGSIVVMKIAKTHIHGFEKIGKRIGSALLVGFGILNSAIIGLLYTGFPSGIIITSVLQVGAGFLVSGVFAVVSLRGVTDQKQVVSPLYAADLLGGCLGSLMGSLVLVPFLGMMQTAGTMSLLALASLLLI
jgi:spermidine synthase